MNSLDQLVTAVSKYRSMHMPGGHRYLAVASFVSGAAWSDPDLIDGWQSFVSVTISGNASVGWPYAVLSRDLSRHERLSLLNGGGTDDENDKAIELLVTALQRFVALSDKARAELKLDFEQLRELPAEVDP